MWIMCVLVAWNVAHADPAPEPTGEQEERARVLFENGRRLFSEGSYAAAAEAWEACYDLTERPELLYNLSNAHERLGNLDLALEFLNRYRAQAVLSPEEHDQLARKASTLELRLNEAEVRRPMRKGAVAGTLVSIGSGAAVAVGAVLGGLALDGRGAVRAACLETSDGLLCPDTIAPSAQRAARNGASSLVLLGVGGVGAITGVTLIIGGGGGANADVTVRVPF